MRLLNKLLPNRRRGSVFDADLGDGAAAATHRWRDSGKHAGIIAEAAEQTAAGRVAAALALVDRALEPNAGNAGLMSARGSILFAWGRYRESYDALLGAVRAGLNTADLHTKLGWVCLWLGRADESLAAMQRASLIDPEDWAAHFGLGTVLRTQKHAGKAKIAFERAHALNESAHCISSLIACEIELDHLEAAERLARRGIELSPKSPGAFADLGMALSSLGRHDEAVAAFEHAESLDTDGAGMGDDCVNFAVCLLRAGRTRQALAMLERRIRNYPSAALQSQYALALLIAGRLTQGWGQYEFRWSDEPLLSARPNFVKPQWDGQDLRDKTVLLWAEQGLGDFIQFIRYARHVKALGATVLVFLREEVHDLVEGLPGIDRILGPREPYPPFDYFINLLSLPRAFGTDLASIPADVPYLAADQDRLTRLADRFHDDGLLKVGIVWQGSPTHLRDRFRSLSLESLAPVLSVAGVRFYSLQKGPAAAALAAESNAAIVDLGSHLRSFADTAAAIGQLDLVLGVDTAVVHLGGALGKPVWTLLPTPADWRWLEERDDSPWYPTMRLFRQRSAGDWSEVIGRVKSALEDETLRRGKASTTESNIRSTLSPAHVQIIHPRGEAARVDTGFSRIAETRLGIIQFFPDDDVGRSIELYGEHRQLQIEHFDRLVTLGMTVVETATGIGVHALWLSRRVGPEGHLYLYEADPRRKQVLRQNLKANRVANVTVMTHTLGRLAPVDAAVETESRECPQAKFAAGRDETIDDLRLSQLDCLKINDGDCAVQILEGATQTLWRLRPRLLVSATNNDELRRVAARTRDFGYVCWRSETALFNPGNFNNREHDVFAGQTALGLVALPEEQALDVTLEGCQRLG